MICIPVRDEEHVLPSLLQALSELVVRRRPVELCFYLDGCHDGGAALLRAADVGHRVRIVAGDRQREPNAGRARRAAVAVAIDALGPRDALLFTTDADSQPAPDWIEAGAAALQMADVVAGRIVRDTAASDPGQSRIERYYDRLFRYRRRLDPVPWEAADTHHFAGGANLAMHASAYRAIGGFQSLPHGEDATLLDDAARAGLRVRRDAAMLVTTSSRRQGRATQGLASALRSLDGGEVPHVAHPLSVAWQARAQALARRVFARIDDPAAQAELGAVIELSSDHVLGVARDCSNGEAFAMRIVPAAPTYREPVALDVAEAALADLEMNLCEAAE